MLSVARTPGESNALAHLLVAVSLLSLVGCSGTTEELPAKLAELQVKIEAEHLTPATDYRFVLILPDDTRHHIGTLRTPAALSPEQFDFAKKAPASGPVAIAWRDLGEPAQLRLGRTEQRRETDGRIVIDGSGPYDPDALRRTIGPGWFRGRSDRWVLPETLLVSSADRKLLALHAEIVATSEGRLSAALSKQSSMQATRRVQLAMEFAAID